MSHNPYIYILIMAAVTFAIRVLSVMTFPAIINATHSPIAGIAAFAAGLVAAWFNAGLFKVSCVCCAVVFILEFFV